MVNATAGQIKCVRGDGGGGVVRVNYKISCSKSMQVGAICQWKFKKIDFKKIRLVSKRIFLASCCIENEKQKKYINILQVLIFEN